MAYRKRNSKGRFTKGNPRSRRRYRARAKANPRRRRRARRNFYSGGLIANPRRRRGTRRRSYRRNYVKHSRRRYRRNPGLLGFNIPPIMDIAGVAAGFIVPPIVSSYIMGWIPAAWQGNRLTHYAVKAASVLLPSWLVKRFVNARLGNLMMLGGAVSVAMDLVREFAPGIIPGLGAQPLLGQYQRMGAYFDRPIATNRFPSRGGGAGLPPIISTTPERLLPTNRF